MSLRAPKNARGVPGADPWGECKKHCNEMYWGDREREGPPAAKPTMFRGVVVIGCVLSSKNGIELVLSTGGAWTWDDSQPEVAFALAERLRAAADKLEREAGS